ncbi:MAG TPA: RluA family pseudouridine synthase [Usitatibacter sp.]|jgi:23S rRNA pseudouridine1911/1915/1917 synthase|nr:RluA family pseudouridine synthase [Usitatibacter sp.]
MKPSLPTVAARVREQTGVAWSRARKLCEEGRVLVDGERCVDPALRIAPDSVVVVDERAPRRESGPLAKEAIVFHDRDVVVIDKPAGMLSVADEEGNKDTLVDHARTLLRRIDRAADAPLGVVHRLDRDTSGLMVFTRSAAAKRHLAAQFRAHDVERVYLAIAHGIVPETTVESDLVLDRGDGLRGSHGHFRRASSPPPREARHAITHLRPLAGLHGATLVECRLETGRQHQIRIHLSELGHPLVGERVYIRDYAGPRIESARPMLHARTLGFTHPRSGAQVSWTREAPDDFARMLEALRP